VKIISIAPCRCSVLGGGTDVDPWCRYRGAEILNFAINIRHTCELTPRNDPWVYIEAMGDIRVLKLPNLPEVGEDPKFDLIYEIIKGYHFPSGFQLTDTFGGIQGSGLGSSASAAVSMIGAFDRWLGINRSRLEIAKTAQDAELNLGWISGFQDQVAAAYGGINYMKCLGFPDWVENKKEIPDYLQRSFVMIFTGKTRHSADIQKGLVSKMKDKPTIKVLYKMKKLVRPGFKALFSGEVHDFANILKDTWRLKKLSNPLTSNENVDAIYDFAMKHGALAGKILGAGGEGHMLFLCEEDKRAFLKKSFDLAGIKTVDFSLDTMGLDVREI